MAQETRPTPKAGIMDIAPYVGGKSSAKPGVRVVKLSSNETPLGASQAATKAYIDAAATLHRYPDGSAQKLREAIAAARNIPAENIVCGQGSDELIGLLVHAYAGAGDDVVISQHGFLMYKIYAQSVGANVIAAPEKNLTTDVDALLKAVTPRTKIMFVANPNNPTGSYIPASELKRLRDNLRSDILLVVDAAYAEYAGDAPGYSCGRELVAATQNTVSLRTFSKIYGLPALRLGWMYGPLHVVDVINRIRGPFNVSNAAIAAGIAAVNDKEFIAQARAHNTKWLAWLSAELKKLGLTPHPSIGNFVLVEFNDAAQASAANLFLMERGLIVREVANYGLPACLRITIGLEEDNKAVVATLAEFLKP